MLYDIGLVCTIALGFWLVVDMAGARPRRLQSLPMSLLGVSSALWAGGELMIANAGAPAEILLGRRLLYFGSAVLPIAWAWTAADAARARWIARAPWLLALAALPLLAIYSLLYTDAHAWFVHGTAWPPVTGPLYWVYATLGWSLAGLATSYFLVAAIRLGKASPFRMLAIVAGSLAPVVANLLYLTTSKLHTQADPTPILLAVAILVVRLAAIDSGLTAFLPVARKDVIEQLPSGVLVSDLADKIVDANPAAAWMLRETRLIGKSLEEVLGGVRADPACAIEVEKFAVKALFGVVGSCAVLNDRTEARRIEQQLQQAQKLEAIGYLTAGIAHGINNPLAFLRSNLGSLEELARALPEPAVQAALGPKRADLAAEAPEIVAEMRDGLDRIAHLVATLMGFARSASPAGSLVEVDLHDVAEKANALASVGVASDTIRTQLEAVPPVLGCEEELVQIATNLLLNAIQASGGAREIDLEVRPDRGQVTLSVRDRGPGIPHHLLPHVFDPFFTTKGLGEGTGLGLSLSFDMARRHGGTLEAANHPGGGAVFTLWLPPAPGTNPEGGGAQPDEAEGVSARS